MLRRAELSDLPLIAAETSARPLQLYDQGPEALPEILNDPEQHLLVWQRDGAFAGFAHFERVAPRIYMLVNLSVSTIGQGEGRALIRAVIDMIFGELGAQRVFCDTGFDNLGAIAAFKRAGFVFEGVWRECWQRRPGEWVDCHGFSMLAREWNALNDAAVPKPAPRP